MIDYLDDNPLNISNLEHLKFSRQLPSRLLQVS